MILLIIMSNTLALKLYFDSKMNCDFLPMAVLPPADAGRGPNFRKKYHLIPGKAMTAEEIRKKYFKTKNPERLEGFDWEFHKRITDKLPKRFWY